jgi:hypothetical protein
LVRHFLLVAVGALRQRVRIQEVMGSPAVPPCLGMSSFGVWHKISTLFRNVVEQANEKARYSVILSASEESRQFRIKQLQKSFVAAGSSG